MENVEVLNLRGTTVTNLNTASVAGLEQVNLVNVTAGANSIGGGTGTTTLTLGADQEFGLNGVTQTGATFTTVNFGAAASSATANLSNGSSVRTLELNGAAIETLNVSSGGSRANTINALTSTGNETAVNLSGSQMLTIAGALAASATTINAAESTGGVDVLAGSGAVTFTGGTGDDTIRFGAGEFTNADSVDGGEGTDTLVLNDTAFAAADYVRINAASNIEALGLATTGATVNADSVDVSNFSVLNAGTTTFNGTSDADSIYVENDAGVTAVNINTKVGQNVVNVELDNGSSPAAAQTVTTLAVTGASTVNLESDGGAANVIGTLTTDDNTKFVITGDQDLTITNAIAATSTGHEIDASGFTGDLSVQGSAQIDVITGGSGADTIVGSQGADEITLGAGNDTVDYNNLNESGATVATGFDTISDWGTGDNTIDFSGIAAFNAGTVVAQSTVQAAVTAASPADLDAAVAAAATTIAAGNVGSFQYGDDTYVFANTNTAAVADVDDMLIELTGQHNLTAADFTLV